MILQLCWEGARLPLLVPPLDPGHGAPRLELGVEVVARLVLVALQVRAAVEVDIVLPAGPTEAQNM